MFLASPGAKQVCPKSAACWSPAIPETGISPPKSSGTVRPLTPALATTRGSIWGGIARSWTRLGRPFERLNVEEHRSGGVRNIGRVHGASGQIPEQPGIDCAGKKLTGFRSPPQTGVLLRGATQVSLP